MRNIWIIARREFKVYFISPIAYAIAFVILLIMGLIFYANLVSASYQQIAPDIQSIFAPLVTLILFTTPALTMRLFAEEQKNGTLELLLTNPIKDWELIIGKWLGAFLFVLSLLVMTGFYPIILNQLINPGIDMGVLLTSYLGIALLSGAFLAIGITVSSLFSNQIAAFFATLGIFLVFWLIGYPAQMIGGAGSEVIRYLDMSEHYYGTFFVGILELKDLLFYLGVIILGIFLGKVSLDIRRWR
jgi:ABC-2 type transport system permease protein